MKFFILDVVYVDYIFVVDINVLLGNVFINEVVGVYFYIYLDEIFFKLMNKFVD